MRRAEVTDGSAAAFAAGTTEGGAHVAATAGGAVMLAPAVAGEFTGDDLPAGWTVTPYGNGGTATMGDGRLTLDGARIASDAVFRGPPRVLDFRATFAARPDQHAGFGIDFVQAPWVMFSTRWGRRLYARTHHVFTDDKRLAGTWFGEAHDFRIEWDVLDITFSIDGERAAYLLVPVPGYARAAAGNQRVGGAPLELEWMRVSPYAREGTFTSRVLDAGATVAWTDGSWRADVPDGTTLALSVRTGPGPAPDRAWSAWRPLACPGAAPGEVSRHLQYRVELATTDTGRTPILHQVTFGHRPPPTGGDRD